MYPRRGCTLRLGGGVITSGLGGGGGVTSLYEPPRRLGLGLGFALTLTLTLTLTLAPTLTLTLFLTRFDAMPRQEASCN